MWENISLWLISIDLLDDLSVALFNFVDMSVVFNQLVNHVFLRVARSLLQTCLDLSIRRPVKSCVVNVWKECGFYSLKSYCFYIALKYTLITHKNFYVHSLPLCLQAPKLHELSPWTFVVYFFLIEKYILFFFTSSENLNYVYYRSNALKS